MHWVTDKSVSTDFFPLCSLIPGRETFLWHQTGWGGGQGLREEQIKG